MRKRLSFVVIWLAKPKILDGPKHDFLSRNGTNGHEQPRSVPSDSTRSNRVETRPHISTCDNMYATEHDRPSYRSSYEYCRVFLVIIRTRSRADGARSGERGGATILCVRTVVFCKEDRGPLHAMQCIMQRTAVAPPFHKLEHSYDAGDHKQVSKYGRSDVSFRTGIFLQDQGPLFYFKLKRNRKSNFDNRTRANHQVLSWYR